MERQGLNLHKKLLQYLNSKSSPHVSDPVCRFIEHLFVKAPELKFIDDPLALSRHSTKMIKQRRITMSTKRSVLSRGSTSHQLQSANAQSNASDLADNNAPQETELPFFKKVKFLNIGESFYAKFKAQCVQEGILQELTIMMQPMKAVATVSSALRLMHFFISTSEIEIMLRELESLPIFIGLKERSDMKFIPRPGGKIKT